MDQKTKDELIEQNEKIYSFGFGSIVEYKGKDEHLVIPDKIVHRKVSSECGFIQLHDVDEVRCIDSFAFQDRLTLKSVEFPETLAEIKELSFCGCKNLEHITLREGVVRIGNMAFLGCDSLKSAVIPDSVTTIGRRALGYGDFVKLDGFTLYGKKGGEAELYARKNGFEFEEKK